MDKRKELLNLLGEDPMGLLANNILSPKASKENMVLISSFEEIQEFVEENGCLPKSNMASINEFKLYSRLQAIKKDPKKVKVLKKYDFAGLLNGEDIREITIDEMISDDPYNLLQEPEMNDIFQLRHVRPVEKIQPEYLSRRKICPEFHLYRDPFIQLHDELSSKKRKLIKFNTGDLQVEKFYILNGILFFLKSIDGETSRYAFGSGERQRFDGRTLCIFDNGTQSDMLFRSLEKAMLLDGYSINDEMEVFQDNVLMEDTDVAYGYIYILKSRNPSLIGIEHLYKIGHTTGSVSQRIKNAIKEGTYLFGEVDIISTYRCYNVNSYDLEKIIHDFFYSVRLDIDLFDNNKNKFKPREWFLVSLEILEEALNLILSNKISNYRYDAAINQIIKRS